MRATIFVLLLSIGQILATNTYSQTTRLSLDLKNTSVKDLLEKIEDQSEFYFIYDATVVDVDREVNVKFTNQLIPSILDEVFKESGIVYKITDRQIALTVENPVNTEQAKSISGKVT
ncbi:MAG: STN domain-containing protein, partial [Draconibacterium sp.]